MGKKTKKKTSPQKKKLKKKTSKSKKKTEKKQVPLVVEKIIKYTLTFDPTAGLGLDSTTNQLDEDRYFIYSFVMADIAGILSKHSTEMEKDLYAKYTELLGFTSEASEILRQKIENKNGFKYTEQDNEEKLNEITEAMQKQYPGFKITFVRPEDVKPNDPSKPETPKAKEDGDKDGISL